MNHHEIIQSEFWYPHESEWRRNHSGIEHLPLKEQRRLRFYDSLSQGFVNTEKNLQREALLRQQPHLKRRIDLIPLRRIVNFVDFKVSPESSIARDRAIAGSDIDGGVVVSSSTISLNQQMVFVIELRKQGFNVYHTSEAKKAVDDYEKLSNSQKLLPLGSLLREKMLATDHIIDFAVEAEADDIANQYSPTEWPRYLPVYLAGCSIPKLYATFIE